MAKQQKPHQEKKQLSNDPQTDYTATITRHKNR
jgi:hypothetical protein